MMDAAVTVQHYSIGDLSREFDVTPRTIPSTKTGDCWHQRRGDGLYADRTVETHIARQAPRFLHYGNRRDLDLYDAPDGEQSQLAFFVGKIRARKAALEDQARDLAAVLEELNRLAALHGVDDAKRRRLN